MVCGKVNVLIMTLNHWRSSWWWGSNRITSTGIVALTTDHITFGRNGTSIYVLQCHPTRTICCIVHYFHFGFFRPSKLHKNSQIESSSYGIPTVFEAFLSGIGKAWLLDSAIFIIIGSFGVVIGINFPNASYFFRSYYCYEISKTIHLQAKGNHNYGMRTWKLEMFSRAPSLPRWRDRSDSRGMNSGDFLCMCVCLPITLDLKT